MAVTTDPFTDVNGTQLESHTNPDGYNWNTIFSAPQVLTIQSNVLVPSASSASHYRILTPNVGDFTADSVQTLSWLRNGAPSAGEGSVSLHARISGANPTSGMGGYTAKIILSGTPRIELWRNSEPLGPTASLLLGSANLPGGLDLLAHTVGLEVHGTSIIAFLDGARAIAANDTAYSTGYCGLGAVADNLRLDTYILANSGYASSLSAATSAVLSVLSRNMVPIPPTVFAFLTARHRPVPGALSLGGTGGSAPPIEGQLWPRGQKSG